MRSPLSNADSPITPDARKRLASLGLSGAVIEMTDDGVSLFEPVFGDDHAAIEALLRTEDATSTLASRWAELAVGRLRWLDPAAGLRAVVLGVRQAGRRRDDAKAAIGVALWRWDAHPSAQADAAVRDAAQTEQLTGSLTWLADASDALQRSTQELHGLSSELSESYEELSLLYKLSSGLTVSQPASKFLGEATHELWQTSGLGWLTLMLTPQEPRLNRLRGALYMSGKPPVSRVELANVGRRLLEIEGTRGAPRIVSAEEARKTGLSPLADAMLSVPVGTVDRPLGVLFGAEKPDGGALSTIDAKLCHALAATLSIFLDNNMLYEGMQQMFLGTLHALTSAIDAKDSYTHGHSERVALLSRMLADAMGLDAEAAERVHLSGLVHDVGKIGVPEAVLCKNGPLTDDEFDAIKRHPEIGATILRDIPQMQDLVPGVLHHHERWDGRGYPHGLAGAEIPLVGRIIGLADAFDAMSSNRTYRQALHPTAVQVEIAANAGKQFDPDVVEAFRGLDLTPVLKLVRQQHLLLSEASKRKTHAA
ncbi:MAG: HD-GYP domain-containing protein [Planctomycetota bacterium]